MGSPSLLDSIKTDLRKFFSAGAGESAVMTLERFVLELIKGAAEDATPTLLKPIVDPMLDYAEGKAEDATQAALEGMAQASSTISSAPSTPADNAPAKVLVITSPAEAALFASFSPAQKAAYTLAHAK